MYGIVVKTLRLSLIYQTCFDGTSVFISEIAVEFKYRAILQSSLHCVTIGAVTLDVLPMGNLAVTTWVGFTLGYVRLPVCGYTLVNYPRGW